MCGLNAVAELADAVPAGWRLGLFGSAARCMGSNRCVSGVSDLDLLIVHPPSFEKAASELRRRLVAEVAALGLVADIIVLSTQELASTRFWEDEKALDIVAKVLDCDATPDGQSPLKA